MILIFWLMKSPGGLWFLSIIFFCRHCGAEPQKPSAGAEECKAFKNLEMLLLLSLQHSPWTKGLLLNPLSAVNKVLLIHKLRILWINYIYHEMTGCNVYISQHTHVLFEHKPASLYHLSQHFERELKKWYGPASKTHLCVLVCTFFENISVVMIRQFFAFVQKTYDSLK